MPIFCPDTKITDYRKLTAKAVRNSLMAHQHVAEPDDQSLLLPWSVRNQRPDHPNGLVYADNLVISRSSARSDCAGLSPGWHHWPIWRARLCNLTKAAFCRYFKKTTGKTFIEFLNQYRISQSKRLLLKGQTVSEAAYNSGFESLSYFNRTFKKIAGENPLAFKQRFGHKRNASGDFGIKP